MRETPGSPRPTEPSEHGVATARDGDDSAEYGNADRDVSESDVSADHDAHDGLDPYDVHEERGRDSDSDDDSHTHGGEGSDPDADDAAVREERGDPRRWVATDRPQHTTGFEMPALTLAVIGCGEFAQTYYLRQISSFAKTTVAAIADASRRRVDRVGAQYGIADRYQRGSAVLTEHGDDLDGVVICSPPHTHAELATQALEAGVAPLVAAPLTVTPDDAWDLQRLGAETELPAMVGYSSRYDPAYHRFGSVVDRSDTIRYVDAVHVRPADSRPGRVAASAVPGPLPPDGAAEADRIRIQQAKDAMATDTEWIAVAYLSHLDQLCHDVNRLRGCFEDVVDIHHVSLDGPGAILSAELGYEDGTRCHLASGRTDGAWSEEYVRVDTAETLVRFDPSDPCSNAGPSAVTITAGTDEVATSTHVPHGEEPVIRELRTFLEAIRQGTPNWTPFVDGAKDVELIAELVSRGTAGMDDAE